MKKFILIFLLILALGLLVWISYQIFPEEPTRDTQEEPKTPSGIPPLEGRRSGNEFSITTEKGTVLVKDFRQRSLESNTTGEMLLLDERQYQIVYYAPDQAFIMTLYTQPISQVQQKAEEALLTLLGITQKEACKLTVSIGVPYQVDPNYIGVNLGLSFCP